MNQLLPDWITIPRDERERLVIDYCGRGLSASTIAKKFQNCSRSAVCGLAHRLKLRFNSSGQPRKIGRPKASAEATPKSPKPPATKRASKLVQQTSSWRGANNPPASDFKARAEQRAASPGLPAHLITGEPRRKPAFDLVPVSRKLALVELTEHTCKWPNGDPQAEDFGFCGNESAEAGPYCRYHARLAYTPPAHRLSVPKGA